MAIQDVFKNNAATSIAVGVAAVLIAPLVLPAVAAVARPLAKAVIKSGLIFYEKGRETFAELNEMFEDIVAEARAEVEQAHAPKAVSAPETPPTPPG
jgi:hypothetical protein